MGPKLNWYMMGILASVACAIHCALLPVVMTSLPLFGVNVINNRIFEWGMILLAFAVGSYALWHGYNRHHQQIRPVLFFSGGFVCLLLKQMFHQFELLWLIPAVILIVWGHVENYRLCHQSKCNSPHHRH